MRNFILLMPVILLFFLTACGKYNYSYIFGVDKSIIRTGNHHKDGDVISLKMSPEAFSKLKVDAKTIGFITWYPIDEHGGITSGKFCLKGTPGNNLVFSAKTMTLDGFTPVIAYDDKTQIVYFIIADGIGG